MRHYIDIHLRPDPEFAALQLMSALYSKLHRALVQLGSNGLAVAFPGYVATGPKQGLGDCLRIIGEAPALAALQALPWLQGMRDHVMVQAAQPVPAHAKPYRLTRVQAKSGVERLRRRAMRRHGLSVEQAKERLPDEAAERLDLPHIALRSASSGQPYLLFLRLEPCDVAAAGTFNSFGLSGQGAVPWF